jgi:hypothetical protein
MNNLSHYQKRVLDKLYGPLEKTAPNQKLFRASKLYRELIEHQEDDYIKQQFKVVINSELHRHLQSMSQFYNFGYFEDNYKEILSDFIKENIDANEKDFIEEYINSQQEIIDKTFKCYIKIDGYESLEVTQFVQKDFFDEFIRSSKKKIEFLNSLSTVKENTDRVKEKNERKRITVKNKKIVDILKQLNLKVDFLREDCTPEDFIDVLKGISEKDIYININNRNFHYLLTKIKEYFNNFSITAVAETNKIHSKTGKLLAAKNLRNSKSYSPSLKNEIDEIVMNFR